MASDSKPKPGGAPKAARTLRSRAWFDNPDNPGMTALYLERQMNFCLLYTSPSPRDLSTSRMPSSA